MAAAPDWLEPTRQNLLQPPGAPPPAPPEEPQEAPRPDPEVTPEMVEELKLELVAAACSSLAARADFGRSQDPLRRRVWDLCVQLAPLAPDFLLQLALFCRRSLGLRSCSCFLAAAAAALPPARGSLRRYLGGIVLLPPDWASVPRLYQSIMGRGAVLAPLPRALRDALTRTFRAFDPHQVAKYRGRPGKRPRARARPLPPSGGRWRRGRGRKPPPPLPPSLFSLRSLVRRLHLRDPPETTRPLLGFREPGGRGRMRLPPPLTWERALSGGGAAGEPRRVTWERLIGQGALPLRALLRNLRGMAGAGLSPPGWERLRERLGREAVTRSQILPSQILQALRALRDPDQKRSSTRRRRGRLCPPPQSLLQALAQAALLAAAALPPLPGSTRLLLRLGGQEEQQEGAGLLALLGRGRAEGAGPVTLYGRGRPRPAPTPPPGTDLLGAARALEGRGQDEADDDVTSTLSDVIWEMVEKGEECSQLLVLSPSPELPAALPAISCLRRQQLRPLRCLNVTARPGPTHWSSRGDTLTLAGFNEAVLRLLAAGDAAQLLAEVEATPTRYGLAPPPAPPPEPPANGEREAPPPPPLSRWRSVRVFISSPFRDMGAERGALGRWALPRLRALGGPRALGVTEVDLRWGVTTPDPKRRVELCLQEVTRCDVIVGLLGERYGMVPPEDPPAPLPAGRSVTELELRTFLGRWSPGAPPTPALIYIRDPALLREIPADHRGDYEAESEEAAAKMAALKGALREHPGVAAVRSYSARWAGSEVGGLQGLVDQVVSDVWALLEGRVLRGPAPPLQAAFQAAQQGLLCTRSRLLVSTATTLTRGHGPNRFLVTGAPGCGRTVFMAGLVGALQEAPPLGGPKPRPRCRVAYHFAGARPDQSDARVALAHLCSQLVRLRGHAPQRAPKEEASYRELRERFWELLNPPARGGGGRLVLLLDDGEGLQEGGALRRDWLPAQLPPRVTVVLSAPDAPGRLGPLPERLGPPWAGAQIIPLGPLPPPDRVRLVEEELRARGRSLSPDQLRQVLGKGGARTPLYLKLLLAELNAFASHEDLSHWLAMAPPTVPALLGQILEQLQAHHGPALLLSLAALDSAPNGLEERELVAVLGAGLRGHVGVAEEVTWDETMAAVDQWQEEGGGASGAAWELMRDLRWLLDACGSPLAPPGSRLHLSGPLLREACARLRLPRTPGSPLPGWEGWKKRAMRVMAALTLREADPGGDGAFGAANQESLGLLPRLLAQAELWDPLWGLFCSWGFLRAHVTHGSIGGLTHSVGLLREAQRRGALSAVGLEEVAAVVEALVGLAEEEPPVGQEPLLPLWGTDQAAMGQGGAMGQDQAAMRRWGLAVGLAQEVCNTPPPCPLLPHISRLLPHGARGLLRCPRSPPGTRPPASRRVGAGPGGRSLAIGPSHQWAALGTEGGGVRMIHLPSARVVQEVPGSVGGVRAVAALGLELLVLGGEGGDMELRNHRDGSRLWSIQAHQGPITDIIAHPGGVASVGLDGELKMWSLVGGALMDRVTLATPLWCLALHPGGGALAVGGWGGELVVLERPRDPLALCPRGGDSVRHVTWGAQGRLLASAAAGGAVRLWAWPARTLLGELGALGGPPAGLAFAPSSSTGGRGAVLGLGEDGRLLLWPAGLGRLRVTLTPPDPVPDPALCLTFDPSGSRLAVGHQSGNIRIHVTPWEAPPLCCGGRGVAVTSLAWAGPEVLVGGGASGTLWLWLLPKPRPPEGPAPSAFPLAAAPPHLSLPLGRGPVTSLAGDGRGLAVATEDGTVGLWSAAALSRLPSTVGLPPKCQDGSMGLAQLGERLLRPHLGPTESMGLSPTGDLLATGGRDHAVALWGNHGAAMGQLRWRQNEAHRDWVCALGWTGRLLISGSLDGTVGLWDPDVGQKLQELEGLEGPPRAVGGHGRAVLAVSASGSVAAWEGAELRSLVTLRGPAQGALPPPGRGRAMAAVTDPEGHTHLWEPLQPPRPRPLGSAGPGALGVIVGEGPGLAPPPGAGPAPQSPAPNHVIVTATRGGAIRMTPLPPPDEPLPLPWDPRSRLEEELVGGCGRVTSLAWSPCGSHVIVGGAKGSLSLWGEGRLLSQAKVSPLPISALGFVAPHELLVASGRQVELWAVGQEQDAYRLRPVSPLAELGVPVLWMVHALAPPPGPPALLLLGDGQVWGYRGGEGLRPLRVLPEEPLPHPLPHLLHQPPDTWVPPDPSVTSPEAWVPPSPYRLPAPPLEPQPLPDGSILVWGGASDPQLRRLVPMEGGLWRSLAPALPPSPLPTHGPTRWFSGARLVPGVGLFLARSDGTLWVCTGRGDPWVRRRVSGSPLTSLQLLGPGLVTTSQEGLARLWDPRGGPPEAHYRCAGPITCCAVHPGSAPGSAPHLALGDAWGHTYMLRWDTPTAACHAHSK